MLDAAVEAMVDIYNRLKDAANGIRAVALELSKINEKLEALTGKNGALKVNIDYEQLGDQIAAALGQSLIAEAPSTEITFPKTESKKAGGK